VITAPHARGTTRALQACIACTVAALAPLAAHAADDDDASVVPYRPSVSTPAALSAPGRLELELGFIRTRGGGDADRVDALPFALKYAFSPDWGVRLQGNAWVHAAGSDGSSVSGGGDTGVVLKRRFEIDPQRQSAFGLELGVSAPTARSGLGSGGTDWTLNGIYSTDLPARLHTDLNLNATRFGAAPTPGQSRQQLGWSASISGPNDAPWSAGFELSGTQRSGAGSTAQWLASVSHAVNRSLALDAGVSHGLNGRSPGWSVFGGITVLLPKLF
jgi:hypothetical protein